MLRLPILFAVLATALLAPAAPAQTKPLDLVPDDAAFALVVRSLADVRDKGEQFFKDNDVDPNRAPRPATFLKQVLDWLNIKKGLDEKGSVALLLPNFKKVGINKFDLNDLVSLIQILNNLVLAIPYDDLGKMGDNFGLTEDSLRGGKIRQTSNSRYVLLRGKHVLLGFREKAVKVVAESKPLTGALSRQQRKALDGADLALHFGAEAWGKIYRDFLGNLSKLIQLEQSKADNEVIEQFVEALGKVRFVVGGLALDREGRIDVVASFQQGKDGAKALKFLSALRGGPGSSDLRGLPVVEPLVAYAAKGAGQRNVHMARALLRVLLDRWLGIEVHFGDEGRKKLLEAFETMYRHLKGSRAVVYRADKGRRQKVGAVASVVILDVDDTDAHRKRWSTLVEVANAAAPKITRQDRKSSPRFAFKPNAEKIDGVAVDWLTVELPGLPRSVRDEYERLLGPDWNRLRMAVRGKQVVGLFGSDVETLKETLTNLKEKKKGLAGARVMVSTLRRLAPERKVEIHLNLRDWVPLMQGGPATLDRARPVKELSSLALIVEEDRIALQIRSVGEEQKAIVRLLRLGKD